MTIQDIKNQVDNCKNVYYKSHNYIVIKDSLNQYLIRCLSNNHCIGLTNLNGDRLNGNESDFFID